MKTVDGGGGGSGGDDFLLLFLADICCSSLWRFVVWYTNRTARVCDLSFEFFYIVDKFFLIVAWLDENFRL